MLKLTKAIRNLGIIAHIDAGKTTTTERMLYYAGITRRIGNVDSGDTVTDYLEAERARGITIQSAAISLKWAGNQVNLIDTPGHADFNFEVVRSLRVLDGAITILDGVAGVEALTEKVWGLATKWKIPRIVYVNKMDRAGAGFSRTVREVVSKLKTPVALVNLPAFEQERLVGVIDVLNGNYLRYLSEDGREIECLPVAGSVYEKDAVAGRQALIDLLSEHSQEVFDEFIANDSVSTEVLESALRAATISNKLVPVLCGSSFRNIGVQSLMDAAIQFLPGPEMPEKTPVCKILAFKVRYDPQRGPLVYVRVYQGTLKRNATLYNATTKSSEKVSKLLRMQADAPVDIQEANCGEIAVLSGTSGIRTGDTLVSHERGISKLVDQDKLELEPIEVPPPVFFVRISPKGPGDARMMHSALDILLREDPSLHLTFDEEAGQHLLAGMGELHLEIATNRLVDELKARVDIGEVMITHKETINEGAQGYGTCSGTDSLGASTKVSVTVSPSIGTLESKTTKLTTKLTDNNSLKTKFQHQTVRFQDVAEQVRIGLAPAIAQGGQIERNALFGLRFEVNVEMSLESLSAELVAGLVRQAAIEALQSSLTPSDFKILEPIMDVQISAPQNTIGTVIADLSTTRRGTINSLDEAQTQSSDFSTLASQIWAPTDHTMHMSKHENAEGPQVKVHAKVPLETMVGYLSSLRSMTRGAGNFEMTFYEFS